MAYYSLLAFFVMEYIRPTSFIPALIPLHLNSVVPLLGVVATLMNPRPPAPSDDRNVGIIGTILGLLFISIPFAALKDPAITVFESVLGYALMGWVIAREITTQERLRTVFKTMIAVHLVVVALSPEMLLDPSSRTHVIASGSFLGDGNDFALSVNIVVPFCLFLFFGSKSTGRRASYALMLIALIACIVASQSRGGTLALGFTGMYYWLRSDKKLTFALLAFLALAAILVYAPPSYFARMDTITNPSDGSAQGRLTSWTFAWNMAMQSPLFGVGAGNFPYLHHQTAHSIYFLILGELGFPGLIALIAYIVWNIRANHRASVALAGHAADSPERQLMAALSSSLIAFTIAGTFLSAIYYPHAYILAGLLTAGRRIALAARTVTAEQATALAGRPVVKEHWALRRSGGPRPATR